MQTAASQNTARLDPEAADFGGAEQAPVMALPRALDLAFASNLLAAILARAGDKVLVLDASGVDYAATPCVQILMAAGRRRDATDCSLVIRHASEAFRRAIYDFGLQPEFTRWMV